MLKTCEGIYQNGKVEFVDPPPKGEKKRVIVTFLPDKNTRSLTTRGINPRQAAELRHRLKTFAADWSRPEMDVYDQL